MEGESRRRREREGHDHLHSVEHGVEAGAEAEGARGRDGAAAAAAAAAAVANRALDGEVETVEVDVAVRVLDGLRGRCSQAVAVGRVVWGSAGGRRWEG
tara:strand:- start:271 stop:567 length:297 start_codon:yes stop_codon:yes gene_type:complete